VCEPLWPCCSVAVAKLPLLAVALCGWCPELVQVTVSPTLTVIVAGENEKSTIVSDVAAARWAVTLRACATSGFAAVCGVVTVACGAVVDVVGVVDVVVIAGGRGVVPAAGGVVVLAGGVVNVGVVAVGVVEVAGGAVKVGVVAVGVIEVPLVG
jgi:hypothetical protein